MIIPNIWKNKTWQPNHQPVINDGGFLSHRVYPQFSSIFLGYPASTRATATGSDRPGRGSPEMTGVADAFRNWLLKHAVYNAYMDMYMYIYMYVNMYWYTYIIIYNCIYIIIYIWDRFVDHHIYPHVHTKTIDRANHIFDPIPKTRIGGSSQASAVDDSGITGVMRWRGDRFFG